MTRMPSSDTPKVRFEITTDKPEENPNSLAILLAEAMDAASKNQQEGDAYKSAAMAELQKARQIQDAIFQIRERKKNPPVKISRMDPLNQYVLQDCEKELKKIKERAVELQSMADDFLHEANANRNEYQRLQIKIREANKKARG